jgi:hypothetical protein
MLACQRATDKRLSVKAFEQKRTVASPLSALEFADQRQVGVLEVGV